MRRKNKRGWDSEAEPSISPPRKRQRPTTPPRRNQRQRRDFSRNREPQRFYGGERGRRPRGADRWDRRTPREDSDFEDGLAEFYESRNRDDWDGGQDSRRNEGGGWQSRSRSEGRRWGDSEGRGNRWGNSDGKGGRWGDRGKGKGKGKDGGKDPKTIYPSVYISDVPVHFDESVVYDIHELGGLDRNLITGIKFLPKQDLAETCCCIVRYCDQDTAEAAVEVVKGKPVQTRSGACKFLGAKLAKPAKWMAQYGIVDPSEQPMMLEDKKPEYDTCGSGPTCRGRAGMTLFEDTSDGTPYCQACWDYFEAEDKAEKAGWTNVRVPPRQAPEAKPKPEDEAVDREFSFLEAEAAAHADAALAAAEAEEEDEAEEAEEEPPEAEEEEYEEGVLR